MATKFLIDNLGNKLSLDTDTITNLGNQTISEELYLNNGFDDVTLLNNTYTKSKVYGTKDSDTATGQIFSVEIPSNAININSINSENNMGKYSENLIPVMTSNTTPSGVASASNVYDGNYEAWRAFDRDNSNYFCWYTYNISYGWLQYKFTEKKQIQKYTVTSRNNGTLPLGAPKNWTFEGSNDGVNWDVLDTRINEIAWSSNEKREYIFNNNQLYLYYRINITSSNTSKALGIGELEMMEILTKVKCLIQDKTNVLKTISEGRLVDLGAVEPTEELFNTQGFDDVLLTNGVSIEPESKILVWIDNTSATKLSLDYDILPTNLLNSDNKLLMYTDNTDIVDVTLNYNCDEYRPIDKTDEQFKILMYKE